MPPIRNYDKGERRRGSGEFITYFTTREINKRRSFRRKTYTFNRNCGPVLLRLVATIDHVYLMYEIEPPDSHYFVRVFLACMCHFMCWKHNLRSVLVAASSYIRRGSYSTTRDYVTSPGWSEDIKYAKWSYTFSIGT